jgi:hypothetical protein
MICNQQQEEGNVLFLKWRKITPACKSEGKGRSMSYDERD